jgi:hypothetical protein
MSLFIGYAATQIPTTLDGMDAEALYLRKFPPLEET